MLDTAVNPGTKLACEWLQEVAGVNADDDIGDETIGALGKLSGRALPREPDMAGNQRRGVQLGHRGSVVQTSGLGLSASCQ